MTCDSAFINAETAFVSSTYVKGVAPISIYALGESR